MILHDTENMRKTFITRKNKLCIRNGKGNFGGFRKIKTNEYSDLQE